MDIIIIGAGLSGIYSASILNKLGYKVKILEARDRIGGRIYTIKDGNNSIDLGGQWISSTQLRVMNIIRQLGLEYFDQYHTGKHIMNFNNQIKIYDTNISNISNVHMVEIIKKLNLMSTQLDNYKHLDRITAKDWLYSNCVDHETCSIIEWLFKVCICVESTDVSCFYWLNFINNCGQYENIANIKGGAQEYRIVGGSIGIVNKLIEKYSIDIELNSPVLQIIQQNNNCQVFTENKTYNCKKVIVTIPPQLNDNIRYFPPLTTDKQHLYSSIKMGQVVKIIILYQKPWWRDLGFSGEIISNTGPIFLSYDCSYDDKYYGLVCFVSSNSDINSYSKESILEGFSNYFGDTQALRPLTYYEQNWCQEKYSEGCYFGITNKGILSKYKSEFIKEHGNIYWAGTETGNEWMGYMEGALESGERVSQQIHNKFNLENTIKLSKL